jgi:serine/threonine protein kinase
MYVVASFFLLNAEYSTGSSSDAPSQVVLATHNATGKVYAAKKIEKKHLLKSDSAKYALTERKILSNCKHPNIIQLIQSFRSSDKSVLCSFLD